MDTTIQKLVMRLTRLFDLEPDTAHKIVEEVIDGLDLTVDDYIEVRHEELQRLGWRNDRIYAQINAELEALRFRAPPLTQRQIRRRIYG